MSEKKHAVVFSGGGADGAYAVGVAKALFNGKAGTLKGGDRTTDGPLDPQIFTGTSIGAFNATFLVSHWERLGSAAVGDLEKVWLDVIANAWDRDPGFRIRLNPFDYANPLRYYPNPLTLGMRFVTDSATIGWDAVRRAVNLASGNGPILERMLELFNISTFVSADAWERVINEKIDFANIRESDKILRIAATNWILGELRIFENHDMTDKLGPAAVRASSSVPGFYPMATVGAQKYVDGAVLMNTPLKPAIHAGADSLHVIYMNTDVKRMPTEDLRSTLDTLYRTQIISWAESVNRDIKLAKMLNEKARAGEKYKSLTIHRYFPPDGLSGALGFLDLNRDRLERIIDEGFQHTLAHNCKANECVVLES